MNAHAEIFLLHRDDHDFEEWEPVDRLPGHWNPNTALVHYFLNDGPPAGTYRCKASGGVATMGWTGERLAA